MSWRTVVIEGRAKLDYKLNRLVVRGETEMKVNLSEISVILIESTAVSITTYLLNELSKRKIKVIFCDEKRSPSSELIPYYGCHNSSLKIRTQINWKKETKGVVWTEIVSEKIRQQSLVLEYFELEQWQMLLDYLDEIEYNDQTNREGHAGKVYFNALFGKKFIRTEDNAINAALNYGYSIMLSAFNREITANGFLTQIGIFHDNVFNHFNLSSDLMEPFRPIVDRWVKENLPEALTTSEKRNIINILNQIVVIDGKKQYVNDAIKIYSRSVFDALSEGDTSLLRFYKVET